MFSLHWLHVQARHCEVASDGFIYYYFEDKLCHHLKNKHSALLHHPRALHTYLILSPHQRCRAAGMISMIKSIPGDYMAMSTRHLNTKAPHPCPLPINRPPPPTILPPLSWWAMHFSTRRKALHTGPAQGSVALDILSWPLAIILLMARVSSSTFIRTSAYGEAGERELPHHLRETKPKKRRQETKRTCQDLLMF